MDMAGCGKPLSPRERGWGEGNLSFYAKAAEAPLIPGPSPWGEGGKARQRLGLHVTRHRENRLRFGGGCRQYNRWLLVQVLYASGCNPLNLSFCVEFDGCAQHHAVGYVGFAYGLGKRLRCGAFRALIRVCRCQYCFEGE